MRHLCSNTGKLRANNNSEEITRLMRKKTHHKCLLRYSECDIHLRGGQTTRPSKDAKHNVKPTGKKKHPRLR